MAGIREQDKLELWTEQLTGLYGFVPRLFHVRNMFFLSPRVLACFRPQWPSLNP